MYTNAADTQTHFAQRLIIPTAFIDVLVYLTTIIDGIEVLIIVDPYMYWRHEWIRNYVGTAVMAH